MNTPAALSEAYKRTRQGSRARAYVELIWQQANSMGRGVEVGEVRSAYEYATGDSAPSSLTSELHSLKRRGVIEVVGGRPGRTLFALPGQDVAGSNAEDEVLQVWDAVRRGWRRWKEPLSTRQVAEELERAGVSLRSDDPNAVRKRLETLSRRTERGPRNSRRPKVRRIEMEAEGGFPVTYWMPANADWVPGPLKPRSKAEWARKAVAAVHDALGIPPSRTDVRWWLDTLPEAHHLRGVVEPSEIGTVLTDTLKADAEHQGVPGRLHELTTGLTCHGGAPSRYSARPPTALDSAACKVQDFLLMLRPADELEGIENLRRRAQVLESAEAFQLAELREELLAWNVDDALAGVDLEVVQTAIRRAHQRRRAWVKEAEATPHQRESRLRRLKEAKRQLSTLAHLAEFPAPSAKPDVFQVGESSFFNLRELQPAFDAAEAMLFFETSEEALVAKARRFPASLSKDDRARRMEDAASVDLALLDRVDAVAELFDLAQVARAAILLEQAELLLGEVLRDVRVVVELLEKPGLHPAVQQALVVGLGWLGVPPAFDEVVEDRGSYEEVSAWVLAIVLADWETAHQRLRAVEARVEGAAGQVVQTALMRLKMGALFSVVG